jgi:hypothetical protein
MVRETQRTLTGPTGAEMAKPAAMPLRNSSIACIADR